MWVELLCYLFLVPHSPLTIVSLLAITKVGMELNIWISLVVDVWSDPAHSGRSTAETPEPIISCQNLMYQPSSETPPSVGYI